MKLPLRAKFAAAVRNVVVIVRTTLEDCDEATLDIQFPSGMLIINEVGSIPIKVFQDFPNPGAPPLFTQFVGRAIRTAPPIKPHKRKRKK